MYSKSAILFLLVCGAVIYAAPVQLAEFTTQESIAKWQMRGAVMKQAPWPDGHPGNCAELVYKKHEKGFDEWPAAMLRHDNLRPSDWRMASELRFDVFAPEAGHFVIQLVGAGGQKKNFPVVLQKGRNNCRIKLDDIHFVNNVAQMHIFSYKPIKEAVYYIGPLYLEMRDPSVLDSRLAKLSSELKNPSSEEKKLLAECMALQKTIRKLTAENKSPIAPVGFFQNKLGKLEVMAGHGRVMQIARENDKFSALWASSLEKIHRENMIFTDMPSRDAIIDAARGESEGVQLAVFSKKKIKSISAKITKLPENANGVVLPVKAISLHPVGYINCPAPAYDVPRSGWWPDPVLEYADELALEQNRWQSWLLEVNVPKNQSPGIYKGVVTIKADNASMLLPFDLKVRNFTLPSGVPYPISTSLGSYILDSDKVSEAEKKKWKFAAFDLFLAHRINPDTLYSAEPAPVDEAKYKIENGGGIFNICYIGGTYNQANKFGDYRRAKMYEKLDEAIAQYRKAGILDKAYFYGYDESHPDTWPSMKFIGEDIKKRYGNIPFVTTAYDRTFGRASNLDRAIDIWCPMTTEYEKLSKEIGDARKRGKKVWWYIACQPLKPYGNIFMEYPAMGSRLLMGMQYFQYKPDGFLYYNLGRWRKPRLEEGLWKHDSKSEWQKPMTGAPLTNWTGYTWCNYNGDGNLYYAGPTGPLAGMRLKTLRDGIEDYMYCKLLEEKLNRGKIPQNRRKEAEKLLRAIPNITTSLTKYTESAKELYIWRAEVAALLEL